MRIRQFVVDVVVVFSTSLVTTMLVSLLWNRIAHRTNTIDWETSFRMATVLGIILPLTRARRGGQA